MSFRDPLNGLLKPTRASVIGALHLGSIEIAVESRGMCRLPRLQSIGERHSFGVVHLRGVLWSGSASEAPTLKLLKFFFFFFFPFLANELSSVEQC